MNINDDKWLESLREQVDGYEVAPSDDLWARIEGDLPKVSEAPAAPVARRLKPLTVVRRAVAVAACAAAVAGAYYLIPDNGSDTLSPSSSQMGGGIAANTEKTVGATDENTEAQQIKASDITGEHRSIARADYSTPATSVEKITTVESRPSDVETSTTPAEQPKNESATEIKETKETTPQQGTTREFLESGNTTTGKSGSTTSSSQRNNQTTTTRKRKNDVDSRWQVALAANGVYGQGSSSSANGFSPLQMNSGGGLLMADRSAFGTTYAQATSQIIDEETETEDVVSFPVQYSVMLRYMITDHWGVNAGLSYTSATSERRSGTSRDFYVSKTKMHYVGIPVTFSYTFFDSRYITLYGLAGGTVEKCVDAKKTETVTTSFNGQNSESRSERLDKRPWQGSLNAGAGLQFNITDRYGIFAEPQAVYDLSDDSDSPARRRSDWSFQLAVGLRLSY